MPEELGDYQKQLQAMRGYLELSQLNSELAVAYLKDTTMRLDIAIEELGKAGIKLRMALENSEKARKEIHDE